MNENLNIDEHALDKEWLRQPRLYVQLATNAALHRSEHETAKTELDAVKADLYFEISKNPDKYGLAKTTEASIQSTILTTDEYKNAVEKVNDARYSLDLSVALVAACDQRKQALENLVKLHLAGYYSSPRVDADAEEAADFEKKTVRRRGIPRKS